MEISPFSISYASLIEIVRFDRTCPELFDKHLDRDIDIGSILRWRIDCTNDSMVKTWAISK